MALYLSGMASTNCSTSDWERNRGGLSGSEGSGTLIAGLIASRLSAIAGAIAGHGGLLKLIFRADDRKLLGVHCFGEIASEVVALGHAVLQLSGRVELFLILALNTTAYSYAYHDATVDGLTRLTETMGLAAHAPTSPADTTSAARI